MIEQLEDSQHNQNTTQNLSSQQFRGSLLGAFKILSQSCPSSVELKWAHEMISGLMKNQIFLDQSLKLIIDYQSSVDYKNLSKLVITTLSTYLKHQQTGTTLVKKISKVQINTKLLSTFFSKVVQDQIKQLLIKSYTQFIYAPGMETIRTQTVDSLTNSFSLKTINIKQILNCSSEEYSDGAIISIMSNIMVARGILKGPIEMTNMKALIKTFLVPTQYLCIHMIKALSKAISSQNESEFIKISGFCDRLVQFLKEIVFYTSKDYMHLVRYSLMKDESLLKIVFEALYLRINYDQQGVGSSRLIQLVVPSKGNKFIDRINEIKKNACAIINHYAKMCVNCQSNQKQFNRQEYKIPLQICKRYIQQIPSVLIRQFTQLQYPNNAIPHQGLYNIVITILANIARLSCFFNQCYKLRNNLFYQLCLPILQRKESEEYLNAEDFKGKREDIMNMHNVDNTENAVCKLIQSYVDKIDGSLSIFSSNMYQAIQFHLSANPNNFNSLPAELTESRFFKQANYFIQIQCYLSVLTLFSYMSVSRDELVILIEKILLQRQQFMFNPSHNGMFKASVLLLYTYYVDNFYVLLKQQKSKNQVFHRQVLEICCENVKLFTENPQLQNMSSNQFLCLQIAALQSLDCISNCLGQKLFLQALFFNRSQSQVNNDNISIVRIFQFFSRQLYSRLNINVIDNLLQFFVQIIKASCQSGFANKRFNYQKQVINIPLIFKRDVCNIFSQRLYQTFSTQSIPNHSLMKHKILHLLEIIISCCEDPNLFLNDYFFSLVIQQKETWEASKPIDIYLRRVLANRQNIDAINVKILQKILISSMQLLQFSCKQYNMHNLFGIIINLMIIQPQIIDEMSPFLANTLVKMLKQQDQSNNFQQDLQNFIQKLGYLNLIAINLRFNSRNKDSWCFLIERIHQFLQSRATKGLIGAKSAPYIGKLLTLCLVCLYNMKKYFNLSQTPASIFLWNNIVRSSDIYITSAQKQIFSSIFILILDEKEAINEKDLQSRHCFIMVSHVLYKAYSKALKGIQQDYGDNKREDQSSGLDSDSDEEHIEKDQLNYREYSISINQYSKKQVKEIYIGNFKNLCHKLKKISPQFLRDTIESLPIPIKNFVKTQVFYFEPGTSDSVAMRKLFKVKKQANYSQ